MTRHRQRLTQEQGAIIKNDYLAGQKPAAIANKIGAKVATVRQAIWRQGLTDEREGIKEAAARTANEVLEDARKRHAERLAGILNRQIEAIDTDTEKLSTATGGWDLVEDAAGASSLMRAKALLQDRTLRHFGLNSEGSRERAGNVSVSMYCVHGETIERSVTATAAD